MTGRIHSFESLAAVDGAGVRYAVFLSGCPLRCVYCHNPDTWEWAGGKEMEAEALARKLARYKPYFGAEGGVTFSGGEPLLQAEFLREMIPLLREREIGYVVDTSGEVPLTETVKEVLRESGGVLLDLKFPDEERYCRYTGRGIGSVLETLRYLESIGKRTVIRTVIVPGLNDSEGAIDEYLACLRGYSCVERYELLGFHTMGFFKYREMGIRNPLADTPALDPSVRERLQRYADRATNRKK